MIEAIVPLDLVARPADQVGGLLDVAERLEAVLADLDREQRAELHLALGDEVRRPPQQRDPLLPRPARPTRAPPVAPPRSRPHVLRGPARERAEHRAVDRGALLEGAVAVAATAPAT